MNYLSVCGAGVCACATLVLTNGQKHKITRLNKIMWHKMIPFVGQDRLSEILR